MSTTEATDSERSSHGAPVSRAGSPPAWCGGAGDAGASSSRRDAAGGLPDATRRAGFLRPPAASAGLPDAPHRAAPPSWRTDARNRRRPRHDTFTRSQPGQCGFSIVRRSGGDILMPFERPRRIPRAGQQQRIADMSETPSTGLPRTVAVNGRTYALPRRPVVVICLDGFDPEYLERGLADGTLPTMRTFKEAGYVRSEEQTSELQHLMRNKYAV